jgi:hypothetical protein
MQQQEGNSEELINTTTAFGMKNKNVNVNNGNLTPKIAFFMLVSPLCTTAGSTPVKNKRRKESLPPHMLEAVTRPSEDDLLDPIFIHSLDYEAWEYETLPGQGSEATYRDDEMPYCCDAPICHGIQLHSMDPHQR